MRFQPKYRAKPTIVDGVRFDSKKESRHYQALLLEQRAGTIKEIELQPKFVLQEGFKKNGMTHRPIAYVADFRVTYADGRVAIVDVKGLPTPVYKMKKKLFEYKFPDLSIVEI